MSIKCLIHLAKMALSITETTVNGSKIIVMENILVTVVVWKFVCDGMKIFAKANKLRCGTCSMQHAITTYNIFADDTHSQA